MNGFKAAFAGLSVFFSLSAQAAWYCPEFLLNLLRSHPAPVATEAEKIDWSKYIPAWHPRHMECRSVDGTLARVPVTGTPKRRYLGTGRYGRTFSETAYYDEKMESGRNWFANGAAVAAEKESFSLPTKKTVRSSFEYLGSSLINLCQDVEVAMTVTLTGSNGVVLHETPVVCQDVGCWGAGKQ